MQHRIPRRAFVETLLVLPAGVFLVRCSSSSSSGNTPPAPGAEPTVSGSQALYTSSVNQDHTHTFGVPLVDFVSPPSGGLSGETSLNASHTHQVTIQMDRLQKMETGSSVAITTTNVSGHTHVFTFVKLSAAPQDSGLAPPRDGGLVTP